MPWAMELSQVSIREGMAKGVGEGICCGADADDEDDDAEEEDAGKSKEVDDVDDGAVEDDDDDDNDDAESRGLPDPPATTAALMILPLSPPTFFPAASFSFCLTSRGGSLDKRAEFFFLSPPRRLRPSLDARPSTIVA